VVSAPVETGQRYETGPPVEMPPLVSIGGSAGWPPAEQAGGQRSDSTGPRQDETAGERSDQRVTMRRQRPRKGKA
jgi:hypothetical protein